MWLWWCLKLHAFDMWPVWESHLYRLSRSGEQICLVLVLTGLFWQLVSDSLDALYQFHLSWQLKVVQCVYYIVLARSASLKIGTISVPDHVLSVYSIISANIIQWITKSLLSFCVYIFYLLVMLSMVLSLLWYHISSTTLIG